MQISKNTALIAPKNLLSRLFEQQNNDKFADIFDETLLDVARANNDIFSVLRQEEAVAFILSNYACCWTTSE
jgi:type I restriction enzyme M protein